METDPILVKARRLAGRGRYDEAIKLLESEVFRYQDSYHYYYLLGAVCLYARDYHGAFTYFSRAKTIKFREPGALLGLAALFLRRGETDRALDLYLDVQDLEAENRLAKKGLKAIRRYAGGDEFSAWLESGKLEGLYPPLPRQGWLWKKAAVPAVIAAVVILTAAGIFLGASQVKKPQRGGLAGSVLAGEERASPVETGGTYKYILKRNDVLSGYDKARTYFEKYHDEAAKRELNRIIESNASAAIRNRARILKSFTEPPGFDTLKDRYTYTDVLQDPVLYRDCYVIWKGMAANIENAADKTVFDLLVGYDTGKTQEGRVLEGQVTVELYFPYAVNDRESLEVLGKIVLVPGAGQENRFMLQGTAVHQSPLR